MPGSVNQELRNAVNSLTNALDAFGKDLSPSQKNGVITQLNLDAEVRESGIQVSLNLISQWQQKLRAITSGKKTVEELFPDSEGDLGLTGEANIIHKIAERVDRATAGRDRLGSNYAQDISQYVFGEEPKAPKVEAMGVTSLFGNVAERASTLILGNEAGEAAGQAAQAAVTDAVVVLGRIGDTLSQEEDPLAALGDPEEALITEPTVDPSPALTSEAPTADPDLASPIAPVSSESLTDREKGIVQLAEQKLAAFRQTEHPQNWDNFFDLVRDNPGDPLVAAQYAKVREPLTIAAKWLLARFDSLGTSAEARRAILGPLGLTEQDIQTIQESFGIIDNARVNSGDYIAVIRRLPLALAALDYYAEVRTNRNNRTNATLLGIFQNSLANHLEALQAGQTYHRAIDHLVKDNPALAGRIFGAHLSEGSVTEGYRAQSPITQRELFIDPEGKIADAEYWNAFFESIAQAPVAENKEGSNFALRKKIYFDALNDLRYVIQDLENETNPYEGLTAENRQSLVRDLKTLAAVMFDAEQGKEGALLAHPEYMSDLALFLRGNLMKTKMFGGEHWADAHREFLISIHAARENFGETAKHDLATDLNATPRRERLAIWDELYRTLIAISAEQAAAAANSTPEKRNIETRWPTIIKDLGKAAAGDENSLFSMEAPARSAFGIIYDVLKKEDYFSEGAHATTLALVAQVAGKEIAVTAQGLELDASQRTAVKVETWDQVTGIIQQLANESKPFKGELATETRAQRVAFYVAVNNELQRLFPENPDEALRAQHAALYARPYSPALDEGTVRNIMQTFDKLARGLSENAYLTRYEYVSLAGVIINHFGGASPELQTAIQDLVNIAEEKYPASNYFNIEVLENKLPDLSRLAWQPLLNEAHPEQLWLNASFQVKTERDGNLNLQIYVEAISGQFAVEYKYDASVKAVAARHRRETRKKPKAAYHGLHKPSVEIGGQFLSSNYDRNLHALSFTGRGAAASNGLISIHINNFAGGKHVPAIILRVPIPTIEKAEKIHTEKKIEYTIDISGGVIRSAYATDQAKQDAATTLVEAGKALAGTLLEAAQKAAEATETEASKGALDYNTTQVPVSLLQNLAAGFIPDIDVKTQDKTFGRNLFSAFFNQLTRSLLSVDTALGRNAHLEAPISFISYLYLESQRKKMERTPRLTQEESQGAAQIQVQREQVQHLVESLEVIATVSELDKHTQATVNHASKSLKASLENSSDSIIGVSVAALAHAYRLREENFFELDPRDAAEIRQTIRHIFAVARHEQKEGDLENINDADIIKRIITNWEDLEALYANLKESGRTYLLTHELDLARRVLLGTPLKTSQGDRAARAELAKTLQTRLEARGHRASALSATSSPDTSSSPEINDSWIKKELSAAVRTIKEDSTHALTARDIPAIKAQFQKQMEAAKVNAEIFKNGESIQHQLGTEAKRLNHMVGLGATSTATFVIVYQPKVDRAKSEPLGPNINDLNSAGQPEFNKALENAIDNNGDLVMPAYHLAIYELFLRKMGFTEADFRDYVSSSDEFFKGEGFELDINEYLRTGQMPDSFWEKCNQYFGAVIGDYNKDRVLTAVDYSIAAGLTVSRASFVASAGAANFMPQYRELVAVRAGAHRNVAEQSRASKQRALQARRDTRAQQQRQRRGRGAKIVP
ncbi:MAG: hypothetical protein H7A32_00690 [Deltaproteobacteria bacterium]|nr:hypothetical protein [Deltaproteobacteria bacterium]